MPDLDDPQVRDEALAIVGRLNKDELPLVVHNGKEYSRPNLVGSVLRKKGEKEEIEKQLETNGTLTDYLKDLKTKPLERYNDEEIKINWGNLFY